MSLLLCNLILEYLASSLMSMIFINEYNDIRKLVNRDCNPGIPEIFQSRD